ncbi:MAG: dihydrofolate reductase [Burkholderiaceae bacterium]
MRVNLIYARARNGVIGHEGGMPWHLPEDLAHFKRLTDGCPVVMGRKTWESLPLKFRPLPGRTNIVVTRQADWQGPGATPAGSLDVALDLCRHAEEVWVIGGAQIYAQALPLAERAVVTELELDAQGDAFAPELGSHWREQSREHQVAQSGITFSWVSYSRIGFPQQPGSGASR